MKAKILQLIDSYWKFDDNQQPLSSWHDKQDLLKAIDELISSTLAPDQLGEIFDRNAGFQTATAKYMAKEEFLSIVQPLTSQPKAEHENPFCPYCHNFKRMPGNDLIVPLCICTDWGKQPKAEVNLPSDEETKVWYDINIAEGCSASSAIYKFRLWLNERFIVEQPVSEPQKPQRHGTFKINARDINNEQFMPVILHDEDKDMIKQPPATDQTRKSCERVKEYQDWLGEIPEDRLREELKKYDDWCYHNLEKTMGCTDDEIMDQYFNERKEK